LRTSDYEIAQHILQIAQIDKSRNTVDMAEVSGRPIGTRSIMDAETFTTRIETLKRVSIKNKKTPKDVE